jgi:3-dehydroquinate synthase
MQIKSSVHDYAVEEFGTFAETLTAARTAQPLYLIDRRVHELYPGEFASVPPESCVLIDASEKQKAFENLTPVFLEILRHGMRRDWTLIVIGGGVLQDIGCFIATVLFRGARWELIPTTLLAQADSCIGSKSSINIGPYKNQIGTFYPPHRVLLTDDVLRTLPWDEIRSGLGEVIKLQLLSSRADYAELMTDLATFKGEGATLAKWTRRSLTVKQPYIETDEFDRGVRNLLNYGHTFGHAYESATDFGIPHGVSVILGILTATFVSAQLGLVDAQHYLELKTALAPWHQPYGDVLRAAERERVFAAIRHDKKNTRGVVQCILTRGPGAMEKRAVSLEDELVPAVNTFIDGELS